MYEYRAKSIAEGVRLALDSRVPFADVIDCKRIAKSRASFEFGKHLRKGRRFSWLKEISVFPFLLHVENPF